MKLSYRKDIDGLRAIAVLSVVFFHADIELFSGGYVGVDIFFVISGFLITSIIYREIEEGDFSIGRFYERRIKRIFPALFSVIFFTLLFSLFFYAPEDLENVGRSIRYTVIFFSNYLFARETGYFDANAELQPLLHTWSLAVEEQYYIVFPVILFFLAKFKKPFLYVCLGSLFILSLVISIVSLNLNAHRAFFVTEGRAWELLIGSFLALNLLPKTNNILIQNILSSLGLILIGWSIFLYDKSTLFPGISALLPTVGAALIIYSGGKKTGALPVYRLLSSKFMVFIGLISYSLYLWHWPLIVFSEHLLIRPLSLYETLVLLCFMGVVAYLSWKYIEQPFRKNHDSNNRIKLFQKTGMVMLAVFSFCLVIKATDGFAVRSTLPFDEEWAHWGECNDYSETTVIGGDSCTLGSVDVKPSFLLWGDSHARAIAPGVNYSAKNVNKSGLISTINGCAPLLGVHNESVEECLLFNNRVIDFIKERPDLELIILSARWAANLEGGGYGVESNKSIKLVDTWTGTEVHNANDNVYVVTKALKRTVKELRDMGRQVVLMSQVPEVGYNVESVAFVTEKTGRNVNEVIAPSIASYFSRNERVFKVLDELKSDATLINPYKILCNKEICDVEKNSRLLYKDDDHLSSFGAIYVAAIFDSVFK